MSCAETDTIDYNCVWLIAERLIIETFIYISSTPIPTWSVFHPLQAFSHHYSYSSGGATSPAGLTMSKVAASEPCFGVWSCNISYRPSLKGTWCSRHPAHEATWSLLQLAHWNTLVPRGPRLIIMRSNTSFAYFPWPDSATRPNPRQLYQWFAGCIYFLRDC